MVYCDVFINCLDSHSDGTHSLQRIHWWASDIMLHFSKSDKKNSNSSTFWMSTFSANLHLWVIYFFIIFMDHSIYVVYGIRAKNIPWYFLVAFGWWLLVRLSSSCSYEVSVYSDSSRLSVQSSQQNHNPLLSVEVNLDAKSSLFKCCMENLSHTWELLHISSNQAQEHWSPSGNHQLQIFLLQSIN